MGSLQGAPAPPDPPGPMVDWSPWGASSPPGPPHTDYGLGMTGGLRIILGPVGMWMWPATCAKPVTKWLGKILGAALTRATMKFLNKASSEGGRCPPTSKVENKW